MLIPISSYYELQMNHDTYAMCTMSLCMQMMAFIQSPFILGPTFSPFYLLNQWNTMNQFFTYYLVSSTKKEETTTTMDHDKNNMITKNGQRKRSDPYHTVSHVRRT